MSANKTKNTVGKVLTYLVALALLGSASAKLFQVQMMVDALGPNVIWVGLIELACVIVFLIPKTTNVGFFLLCSYIGGIIATEWLGMGGVPVAGVVLNVLLWVGMYLRKPSLFGI